MSRKKLEERNIRKLNKVGGTTYMVTIPIEIVRELGWKEKQKVTLKKYGKGILIQDWVK